MADRVELQFRRAALRCIPEGCPLLVAVSGGGDSVALLHLLLGLAPRRRLDLTVAHLDHGLRRGSATDRRFVARLAAEHGLRCISDRRDVARLRRRDESPEEAARRVRRRFLLEARKEAGAERIATGHTLDDQAETVLMRLVRGVGAAALAGMAEVGPGPLVRPLLGLEREALRGWLERRSLLFRDDPSNRDLRFDRNRVRRLVLPTLVQTLNPRAGRHLVDAAERLREDAELLDELARRELDAMTGGDRTGRPRLDVCRLAQLEPPLGRRVARIALARAGVDERRISARHVLAVLDLAGGAGGREVHLPGKLRARRVGRSIRFETRVN